MMQKVFIDHDKYLIVVDAKPYVRFLRREDAVIKSRGSVQNWLEKSIMNDSKKWTDDPEELSDIATVLKFENNSDDDLYSIKERLRELFV